MGIKKVVLLVLLVWSGTLLADPLSVVSMYHLSAEAQDGVGDLAGHVMMQDTRDGLTLIVDIANVSPGEHGFHVHENPSCVALEKEGKQVLGLGAGGHFDPLGTQAHLGPHQSGHLGDLPRLIANEQGEIQQIVVVPRLTVANIMGRAFVIHAHGDNYSDEPEPLGGGGARIVCGAFSVMDRE